MVALDVSRREANIYGSALAYAPSYSSPEIWTTLNRRYVGGKPLEEHRQIALARTEYDRAIRSMNLYDQMEIAGIRYQGETAREFAKAVQETGAPIHSVINAWNLVRVVRGEKPADIYETDRDSIQRIFDHALLLDFLAERS